MLLCKGKQCRYRKTCQRYVAGLDRTQYEGCDDSWIDHCLHTSKYEKAAIEREQSQTGLDSAEREQARPQVKVEQPPKGSYPRGC